MNEKEEDNLNKKIKNHHQPPTNPNTCKKIERKKNMKNNLKT